MPKSVLGSGRFLPRNVALLGAIVFSIWAGQSVVLIVMPLAANGLGASPALIGILVAVPNAIAFLFSIPVAVMSDGLGRRAFIVAGSALGLATSMLVAVSTSEVTLFVGAVGFGCFLVLSTGPTLAFSTEFGPERLHARIQGYNATIQAASALVAPLLAGAALGLFGISGGFAIIGGLSITALGAAVLMREQHGYRPRNWSIILGSYRDAVRLILASADMRTAALQAVIFTSTVFVIGGAFLPLYFVVSLGWEPGIAAAVLSVRGVAALAPGLFLGRAVELVGGRRLAAVAGGLTILPLAAIPLLDTAGYISVLLGIHGIGVGLIPGSVNLLVTSGTTPDKRALGFASVSVFGRTPGIALPVLLAFLAEVYDLRTAILLAMTIVFVWWALLAREVRG